MDQAAPSRDSNSFLLGAVLSLATAAKDRGNDHLNGLVIDFMTKVDVVQFAFSDSEGKKDFGYLAAAIGAGDSLRLIEEVLETERLPVEPESQSIGNIKQRIKDAGFEEVTMPKEEVEELVRSLNPIPEIVG